MRLAAHKRTFSGCNQPSWQPNGQFGIRQRSPRPRFTRISPYRRTGRFKPSQFIVSPLIAKVSAMCPQTCHLAKTWLAVSSIIPWSARLGDNINSIQRWLRYKIPKLLLKIEKTRASFCTSFYKAQILNVQTSDDNFLLSPRAWRQRTGGFYSCSSAVHDRGYV